MTTVAEFPLLTITEASKLIRARALSPVELARTLVLRIDSLDSQINAFNTLVPELALKHAQEAETEIAKGRYRGAMHGIPYGVKDIYDTAGILTSAYSRTLLSNVPEKDATAVAKLAESGAILLGKLATHELANGGPSFDLPWPPARNPWNREHATGGSSSGPAAAVAAGFVPAALGSDTGGSIRIPAALCGVVGLKPTFGLVSRAGVIPHSFSFDHCGPLTWTVEDCAIVLQAISGHDLLDPASAERAVPDYRAALNPDIRGLRIGVVRHFWEHDLAAPPEVCRAMDAALEVLCELGARIEEVRMEPLEAYYDVKNVITKSEVFALHHRELAQRAENFGSDFLGLTLPGCLYSSADYLHAQAQRSRMVRAMSAIYRKHDVLVTASSGPAPALHASSARRVIDHWSRANIETAFSVTGGPALALCNGYTAGGLPLSMQIAGKPFDEATVLRVGYSYENATAWRGRRPNLVAGAAPVVPVQPAAAAAAAVADCATRDLVAAMARRAGLQLTDARLEQLCLTAPYALGAASRLRALVLAAGG
jgi:aspartyl-tRNA(Asn)/glutamyl-tRNA(Gln) amidotransferase subunit A